MAEADMMRAEKPLAWLLPARVYAGYRLNMRPANRRSMTGLEHHTGKQCDLSAMVPYLFGVDCSVLEDEPVRGPKGAGCAPTSTDKGRTSL
eukprot:2593943-Prymnesium_polylepis.1